MRWGRGWIYSDSLNKANIAPICQKNLLDKENYQAVSIWSFQNLWIDYIYNKQEY